MWAVSKGTESTTRQSVHTVSRASTGIWGEAGSLNGFTGCAADLESSGPVRGCRPAGAQAPPDALLRSSKAFPDSRGAQPWEACRASRRRKSEAPHPVPGPAGLADSRTFRSGWPATGQEAEGAEIETHSHAAAPLALQGWEAGAGGEGGAGGPRRGCRGSQGKRGLGPQSRRPRPLLHPETTASAPPLP